MHRCQWLDQGARHTARCNQADATRLASVLQAASEYNPTSLLSIVAETRALVNTTRDSSKDVADRASSKSLLADAHLDLKQFPDRRRQQLDLPLLAATLAPWPRKHGAPSLQVTFDLVYADARGPSGGLA